MARASAGIFPVRKEARLAESQRYPAQGPYAFIRRFVTDSTNWEVMYGISLR